MALIETFISIVGQIHSYVSGIKQGKRIEQLIDESKKLNLKVEKLTENILYAPDTLEIYHDAAKRTGDYRKIRDSLEPVQNILGNNILSSSIVTTSQKLQQALTKNPFEVLDLVKPLKWAESHPDPHMFPVVFDDDGTKYAGWIKKGLIPVVFGLDYDEKLRPLDEPTSIVENKIKELHILREENARFLYSLDKEMIAARKLFLWIFQDSKHFWFEDTRDNWREYYDSCTLLNRLGLCSFDRTEQEDGSFFLFAEISKNGQAVLDYLANEKHNK